MKMGLIVMAWLVALMAGTEAIACSDKAFSIYLDCHKFREETQIDPQDLDLYSEYELDLLKRKQELCERFQKDAVRYSACMDRHVKMILTPEEPDVPSEELSSATGFQQGLEDVETSGGGFKESFKYGFEQSLRGNAPWYVWLLWLGIVGLCVRACIRRATSSNRNPWIWGGLTALCILIPIVCWVPYVVLRMLKPPTKQQGKR